MPLPRKKYVKKSTASKPRRAAPKKRYTKRKGNKISSKMILYKAPQGVPFPREWYGKIRCKISGYFDRSSAAPVGFGSAQNYHVFLNVCQQQPFADLGAVVTMNGTGTAFTGEGFSTLCNVNLYKGYQVLATSLTCKLIPLNSSDNLVMTITPTDNSVNPAFVSDAYTQSGNKKQYFINGSPTKWCKIYTNWARFLGVDKKVFNNQLVGQDYAAPYNNNPPRGLGYAVNINTLDLVNPSVSNIPFEFDCVQYVRFFDFANASLQP